MNPIKVLIVEDDADLSRVMAMRLRHAGLVVTVAQDAFQAVRFERENRPDVVVLDMNLPAGSGLVVHERLKAFSDFCAPVIYMTGDGSSELEVSARSMGAAAFLKKPVEVATLAALIKACYSTNSPAPQGFEYHD